MKATKVNAGLAESNGRLLLGIWRDSLHVTCGLTACTPGSAPGPTLGNEYGKTLPLPLLRDVSLYESKFECCRNPTILGKSKIRRIYGLVYIRFRLTVRCIKLIHHSLPPVVCHADVNRRTLNRYLLMSV